jgi:hypothetical protein
MVICSRSSLILDALFGQTSVFLCQEPLSCTLGLAHHTPILRVREHCLEATTASMTAPSRGSPSLAARRRCRHGHCHPAGDEASGGVCGIANSDGAVCGHLVVTAKNPRPTAHSAPSGLVAIQIGSNLQSVSHSCLVRRLRPLAGGMSAIDAGRLSEGRECACGSRKRQPKSQR